MKFIPYLMFAHGRCEEAFQFYAQALGGQILATTRYSDMPGSEQHIAREKLSRIANVHLQVKGVEIMGADNVMGPDTNEGRNDTTVNVEVESVAEAERVFNALSADGQVMMPLGETEWAERFGMFSDRYGKPWMVNLLKPRA